MGISKRRLIEMDTIETKAKQTKQNGTKPNKTESLSYEIPMSPVEALQCLTKWQKEERKNQNVTAVGYRVNNA